MVNRVILIGNLGKDPEVRHLENGAKVAKFTLATHENYRDKSGEWQKQTEWHDIIVWRELAERAEAILKRGMPVYVEGKLTHRTWQDQDGNNRKTTEVVANYFRSLAGRREDGTEEDAGSMGENTSVSSSTPMPDAADDDLPF